MSYIDVLKDPIGYWRGYYEERRRRCPPLHTFSLKPYVAPTFIQKQTDLHTAVYEDWVADGHVRSCEVIKMTSEEARTKWGVPIDPDRLNYGYLKLSDDLWLEFDVDSLTISCYFPRNEIN